MSSALPVGIFDSGFGGLSVARAIRAALPAENLIFVADCAYAPYGDRSEAYINDRLDRIADFLLERRVKAIVIACNTATAVGAARLRERLPVPIVGIEPAVFPALRQTRTGRVGVLATSRTLTSAKYADVKARALAWASAGRPMPVEVIDVPCPGLMDFVERGEFDSPALHALLERYVDPLAERGVDRIVLGCTHYPFLAEAISRHAPGAELIDPAPAVAQQLERRLAETDATAPAGATGDVSFFASGADAAHDAVLRALWPAGEAVRFEPTAV